MLPVLIGGLYANASSMPVEGDYRAQAGETVDWQEMFLPGEPYDGWFLEDMRYAIRNCGERYGAPPDGVILPEIESYDDIYSVPCNMIGAYYFIVKCGGDPGMEMCFSFYVKYGDPPSRDDYILSSVEFQELWYFSD
jgi:hypothetical protein